MILDSDFSYLKNKYENNYTAKKAICFISIAAVGLNWLYVPLRWKSRQELRKADPEFWFSTFERVNSSVVLSDVLFFLFYSETREYTCNLTRFIFVQNYWNTEKELPPMMENYHHKPNTTIMGTNVHRVQNFVNSYPVVKFVFNI
jgi:hypothetical protein